LAKRIGVSQPRVAKIEQSRNVTIDVLEQYIRALGGELEVTAFQGGRKIPLLAARSASAPKAKPKQGRRLLALTPCEWPVKCW